MLTSGISQAHYLADVTAKSAKDTKGVFYVVNGAGWAIVLEAQIITYTVEWIRAIRGHFGHDILG